MFKNLIWYIFAFGLYIWIGLISRLKRQVEENKKLRIFFYIDTIIWVISLIIILLLDI